jgi:3-dehydroquinate synthase
MVDSSVGGKTGINLTAGKNLAGAFWQPIAVFADTNFLATLPPREFAAGTAEIIKYALLVPDKTLWHTLTQNTPLTGTPLNWQHPALPEIIRTCCAIKAAIVADDERETAPSNGRALLNLGHTFAHAIENTAGYGQYLHGEAVAIGILCAARLSAALGFLDPSEIPAIENLLLQNNLPTTLRSPLSTDTLLAAMQHDKKARAGSINFVLLKSSEQRTPNEGQRAESEQRAIAAAGAFTHTLTLASPATTALLRQIWQTVQPTAHRSTFSSPAPDFSNS